MSAYFRAVNPKNNQAIKSFNLIDNKQVELKVNRAYQSYINEKKLAHDGFEPRFEKMRNIQQLMKERKDLFAETMTSEMGKPIGQAKAEIDKCVAHIDYYMNTTLKFAGRHQIMDHSNAYMIH
eukprot:CAMPEP_0176348540 /NCGR_PEP_ID=MMETSP0126-20121128/7945_1 /TAXON_ID=141414 ORGANISM="Strombidinopsis acuminatum, Strain SPMC142" /NCGR_SAMPLE_ID=MMETSP0126 /ASSEMBLY_ACC=CAM_ASM_000229 /LENGTH=122 /DNA_ID=CAMNT_0017697389 /DNA_START=25 /DNA_END=393 /DNA_ORIENTATION=+